MSSKQQTSNSISRLTRLEPGMQLLLGGDRMVTVPDDIVKRFKSGDSLALVQSTGEVLLVDAVSKRLVSDCVSKSLEAFGLMNSVTDDCVSQFFETFAQALEDDGIWQLIQAANDKDVELAQERGRSTTRLIASSKMRTDMINGLRGWIDAPSGRGEVVTSLNHDHWKAQLVRTGLGVVGFVFEGRPNVVSDATGVLRGGNTVIFRIGKDALGTAGAIMEHALRPSLVKAGLPENAVMLIESPEHAAGWALFSDRRLSLAVARGSGSAVDTLGALAQQVGVPVSLHGTGGAWMVASEAADIDSFKDAVVSSLDRKVCNTLNVCCIVRSRAKELVPAFIESLGEAGKRLDQSYKLHVVAGDQSAVAEELFGKEVIVNRASGDVTEMQAEVLEESDLGTEWEWEQTPEVTLKIVEDTDEAVRLFNQYSPQFVASLISEDDAEFRAFFQKVNAPFVGNGPTRWVDGQKALNKPELGLSNWQNGRLFGRGGILSGDSVYTVRTTGIYK